MKHVVITGSTRGIGRGMAVEFLKRGWMVTVNGRTSTSVTKMVEEINLAGYDNCLGSSGSVSSRTDMKALWDFAQDRGPVHVWINNAGIDQSRKALWELTEEECRLLLDVNLLGILNSLAVVVPGMKLQGEGRIYNMEGFGSNGMTQKGISLYGTTKAGVTYLSKSLKKELAGSPVLSGVISPGMVMTDLLVNGLSKDPAEAERTKRAYNILADEVETVTSWIVKQIVEKESLKVVWLTSIKVFWRFMTASFRKRDLFKNRS